MAKREALLVGLTRVDPRRYGGRDYAAGVSGSELDVDRYAGILAPLGYAITPLKTEQATTAAILTRLQSAAQTLSAGDMFVFCFAGHGGSVPDRDGDEARDGDGGDGIPGADGRDSVGAKDEVLLAYDWLILDDQLGAIWPTFAPGVRLLMISDSCNSGTNFRAFPGGPPAPGAPPASSNKPSNGPRGVGNLEPQDVPPRVRSFGDGGMKASLIHFGAARDLQESAGFGVGGAFSLALEQVWSGGTFQGNYRSFHAQIASQMQATGAVQTPTLHAIGPAAAEFLARRPFDG